MVTPALVDLSPDVVFRERMRRYPGATSINVDELLVQMLNLDGPALAAAALRRIDPAAAAASAAQAAAAAPTPATTPPAVSPAPEQPAASPVRAEQQAGAWWLLLLAVAVGTLVLVGTRRRFRA